MQTKHKNKELGGGGGLSQSLITRLLLKFLAQDLPDANYC